MRPRPKAPQAPVPLARQSRLLPLLPSCCTSPCWAVRQSPPRPLFPSHPRAHRQHPINLMKNELELVPIASLSLTLRILSPLHTSLLSPILCPAHACGPSCARMKGPHSAACIRRPGFGQQAAAQHVLTRLLSFRSGDSCHFVSFRRRISRPAISFAPSLLFLLLGGRLGLTLHPLPLLAPERCG